MSDKLEPRAAARSLLDQAGFVDTFELEPIPGGRNNKVWRLEAAGTPFLLKEYYWTPKDRRDRIGHEWSFLKYLEGLGCTMAPKPFAADRDNRFALLEFIGGERPQLDSVTRLDIGEAADFFATMNAGRSTASALALSPASEACFSLEEHVKTTRRRVARLEQIAPMGDLHLLALKFVAEELRPLWEIISGDILSAGGTALTSGLTRSERCLSPSDFGFHNSLRTSRDRIRFVDFEYAGWDDPAKTIADFANQPDMLLDAGLSSIFRDRALGLFLESASLEDRLRLLTPLYQLKWACICLNEFLPGGAERRAFMGLSTEREQALLEGHLARAQTMLRRAEESSARR